VIPMGLWGTEQVWPRNARLPRIDPLRRPRVTVRIGPPVELTYDDLDTDTKRNMAAIIDLLPPEAHERRTPTEEEHRRTYPPATAATRPARPSGGPDATSEPSGQERSHHQSRRGCCRRHAGGQQRGGRSVDESTNAQADSPRSNRCATDSTVIILPTEEQGPGERSHGSSGSSRRPVGRSSQPQATHRRSDGTGVAYGL
jgi:hypothetical protein